METCNLVYGIKVDFLKDEKEFDKWYQQMPSERRKMIDALKPEGSKRLSLGAGILLVNALKEHGLINPMVEAAENGKPYITGEDGAFFNLSHSGEVAVCAFSDEEVSIDVERNKDFSESLIDYVFDKREIRVIRDRATDKDSENAMLTSLWTIKESLMKYHGQGLSMDPKTIFIDLEDDFKAYHKGELCSDAYFTRFKFEDYQICVCSGYKDFAKEISIIN